MRNYLLAAALFVAVPISSAFAQPVERARVLRPSSATSVAAPAQPVAAPAQPVERQGEEAPVVDPTQVEEPKDAEAFLKLLFVTGNAIKAAVSLGTLVAVAVAALAVTYLLMFLAKSALKLSLPEEYRKLLRAVLVVLTVVAGVLGYVVVGVPGAVVAGLGSAAASPVHDALDGIRALKALKTKKA